ncbi:MAG: rod shape-determining protein MreC [Patescibacteria group bacterium]
MKMIYQTRNTKKGLFDLSITKTIIVIVVVVVMILVLSSWGPVGSLTGNILSPVFKTGNFFYDNFGQIPKYFSDKNKILEENSNLLNQIENGRIDKINYESVKYENDKLRQDLKLKPIGDFLTTTIIAKPPQVPLDSLFLDIGTNDGVSVGDLVFAGERILIGKIVKVSGNKATAALNSFAGVISYGYIDRTLEPLEIKGNGGGGMETNVPIDFDIKIGDKIMIGGSFNSTIAVVGAIEEDRSSGFKNILMSLSVDISKINTVFIYHLNA